jgi:hypothetical protein
MKKDIVIFISLSVLMFGGLYYIAGFDFNSALFIAIGAGLLTAFQMRSRRKITQ